MENSVISVKNVSFSYGNNNVLDDVSLEIERNSFLAIVGANGSGKSTLIRIMLGLLAPDSGSVEVLGESIKQFHQFSKIGYVAQKGLNESYGFPASVREVVGLPFKFTWSKTERKKRQQRIDEVLDLVDMKAFGHHLISELSGGQLQRVLIARELIMRPEILFLDEPTNGLDKNMIKQLFTILKTLNTQEKLTIILITHSDEHLRQEVHQTLVVEDHGVIWLKEGEHYHDHVW